VSAVPGLLLLWALLAGLVALLLARTRYGKHLYAVGTQRTVATLSGVRVHAVLVATYALSGLAASLGGVVILGYTQQVFLSLGDPYTLPSVAAVVVGGDRARRRAGQLLGDGGGRHRAHAAVQPGVGCKRPRTDPLANRSSRGCSWRDRMASRQPWMAPARWRRRPAVFAIERSRGSSVMA